MEKIIKYNFNGKTVRIPRDEIDNYMKVCSLSEEDAIAMWLDDNEYTTNEEQEQLSEYADAHKPKMGARDEKKERKPRTRKVDDEKVQIVLNLADFLREMPNFHAENVEIVKKEREISFRIGENDYSVQLVKHRPPKN